mmetsp:Transcript_3142/g.5521  ORF Transcript_3142/g.5521 Transcript_3142/m.5521 type:complete len:736 (-) Transcript_3142:274-2481(-)|eukprot:CAMPEP_0182447546 /NCGR_PEP_ID=MMETSP1172-20130603/17332_1 /TAXON_ID=708627 /ORGANISM="Timspurckia oligopyrenoides, Strain CCMP3278" /LENGTH=735 /DNA_ID=CAMNT_0024644027 /DNA_START=96 /DNA_END=2303 /DNA_ORIENTATION=-
MQYFSKFLSGSSSGLGYTPGDRIEQFDTVSIWELQHGKHKETAKDALIFTFNPAKSHQADASKLARSAVQKLKTLRHPDVLKFMASEEAADGSIVLVTEPAIPLANLIRNRTLDASEIPWGFLCVARAICFLHSTQSIHGRICDSTIYVTPGGDWKLAGFEIAAPVSGAAALQSAVNLQPETFRCPELVRGMWNQISQGIDSWALGCLLYACYAKSTFTSPDQLRNIDALPAIARPLYQRLLASNPMDRISAEKDVESSEFVNKSKYVETNLFLENLALKDTFEKEAFFNRLPSLIERMPRACTLNKLLPLLSANIEGGISAAASFSCILKLKPGMNDSEFKLNVIEPYALAWYSNATLDRSIRIELLKHFNEFAPFFDEKSVNNQIFPAYTTGFQDTQSPALRDLSVKNVLLISDRLNDRNLNTQLMSHFAKLQVDPEAAIRTNTTVCLSKLAQKMSESARAKVLVPAFLRALKDPFPPARTAGLVAYKTCKMFLSVNEVPTRVLPAIMPLLLDGNPDVRRDAFACIDELLPIVRSKAAEMDSKSSNGAPSSNASGSSSTWGLQGFSVLSSALSSSTSTTKQTDSAFGGNHTVKPASPNVSSVHELSGFGAKDESITPIEYGIESKGAIEDKDEDGWGDFMDPDPISAGGGSSSDISFPSKPEVGLEQAFSLSAAEMNKPLPINPNSNSFATVKQSNSAARRKAEKKADDDWGELLGPSKPKPRGAPKLGAVRR